MNFPVDLKYTKEHEWIRIDGQQALVGITDYAQGQLGEIVYIDVQTVGDTIQKGQVFGTVEAVKTISDLFIPITGKVLELNADLEDKPELVNSDPYGEGWIIKVAVDDVTDVDTLLSAEEYQQLIAK